MDEVMPVALAQAIRRRAQARVSFARLRLSPMGAVPASQETATTSTESLCKDRRRDGLLTVSRHDYQALCCCSIWRGRNRSSSTVGTPALRGSRGQAQHGCR